MSAPADAQSRAAAPADARGRASWPATALAWAAALALVGPFLLRPVWDTDAGWHLAAGRLIRASGLFRENALAWTFAHETWYPTSWLYDWICAALDARLGVFGVQLCGLLLLAGALALWALALREADAQGPWLLPAGALGLALRITHRPHLATWAALAAVVALGLRGRGRSIRWRLLMAAVVALASNLHAGAGFAAGVAGLFCLEEAWRMRRPAELAAAALCGLAIACNPGGLFIPRYLVAHLRVQEVVELVEFLPATLRNEAAFFALVPAALVVGVWQRRSAPAALLAGVAVLGAFGLRSNREAYDALVPAVVLLAFVLEPLRERFGARLPALACTLLAAETALTAGFASRLPPVARAAWNDVQLPVRAVEFLRQAGLRERGFASFGDGGYLEAQGIPAFADGRVQAFPESFWRAFYEAERAPDRFRAWLRSLGVEWALTPRIREKLAGFRLMDGPDWALVYWDAASEVWLRRDVPALQPIIARFEYRHFRPYGSILGAVEAAPRAELTAYGTEVQRYLGTTPGDPYALLVLCALATRAGAPSAGATCDAAAQTDAPAVRALVPKARALQRAAP